MGLTTTDLEQLITDARERHGVPGVSAAVLIDGEVIAASSGVANLGTGAVVSTQTRFLIGSVSKLFTTTLMLRLVDEGKVALDELVRTYLPQLRLGDPGVLDHLTVRHLLSHTSGIEGDHFEDTGRGDDAVERYVETLADIGTIHPHGEMYSYCNAGFVLAGRIIEVATGLPYRVAVREHLLLPLEMDATLLPEEAILGHVAVGHTLDDQGQPKVVDEFLLPHSMGPAGSLICTTATDLLRFASFVLEGGALRSGEVVLSTETLADALRPHATIPAIGDRTAMGLGFFLEEAGGHRVLHHGGATTGQLAKLWILPDDGIAIATLTNGARGSLVNRDIAEALGRELLDVDLAPLPPPARADVDLDLDRYTGAYERHRVHIEVRREHDTLVLHSSLVNEGKDPIQSPPRPLRPIDERHFRLGDDESAVVVSFVEPDGEGRPSYLYAGRVARRVG